ncbi:MAG: AAA family ATPase [Bacilli bacterium]
MTNTELYDSFLKEFPLENLHTMTLEQYTNLNKINSFCYWLEAKTTDLGSIYGGSSYKFGIYKYNVIPKRKNDNDSSYIYDNEYAWLKKHGINRSEAFNKIKSMICQIANAANEGKFEKINSVDLGDTYKWKIAFLYSNKKLISIFNPEMLRIAATEKGLEDAKAKTVSEVQKFLLEFKGNADIFEYSKELWRITSEVVGKSQNTWLYAPGDGASFWDDFYNDNVMGIGWDDLEDLSKYKNQSEINKEIQNLNDTKKSKLNDAKACYDFCNIIKIGDTIIVKKGLNEILGYGTVESNYSYDNSLNEFCHRRDVSWKCRGNWVAPYQLPQKTLTKKDDNFRKTIMDIITNGPRKYKDEMIENLLLSKKQIILQGAPGTGKTYKTAELAVAICNRKFKDLANRNAVIAEYNRLKSAGQIAFTTFHQSMDYEEFVEGLKPISTANGVVFEPKAGLFKEICDRALLSTIPLNKEVSTGLEFDEVYNIMLNGTIILKTRNGSGLEFKPNSNQNLNFRYTNNQNSNLWSRNIVSKDRLKQLYKVYNKIDAIDNMTDISGTIRAVIKGCDTSAYWAVLKHIVNNKNTIIEEPIDIENFSDLDKDSAIQVYLSTENKSRGALNDDDKQNYVLVIDEINRGNISKILGELITLLEADKRIGEQNELTAKLPYSQKEFGVPSNLYIIGTMNTADRNVGYIDYAIRRRFGFVTIKSDFNVIESVFTNSSIKELSKTLYKAVEEVMDCISPEFNKDDLTIGHSYFIAKTKEELEMKLEYEIKPLLREYANDGILNLQKNNDTGKYLLIEKLTLTNAPNTDEQQ